MSLACVKTIETVGIIGTAGRTSDGARLSIQTWWKMLDIVESLLGNKKVHLVSGGAAWTDHLAVNLFLKSSLKPDLSLELPCKFDHAFDPEAVHGNIRTGIVSNLYHQKFSKIIGFDSLDEIRCAIESKIPVHVGEGFFDRNLKISKADRMIAFTFGNGPKLKDGGTAHTAKAYIENGGKDLYHVNLNDFTIHHLSCWPA